MRRPCNVLVSYQPRTILLEGTAILLTKIVSQYVTHVQKWYWWSTAVESKIFTTLKIMKQMTFCFVLNAQICVIKVLETGKILKARVIEILEPSETDLA